jgi:hypothetical protein
VVYVNADCALDSDDSVCVEKPKGYDELKKGFYKRRLKAIFDERVEQKKT